MWQESYVEIRIHCVSSPFVKMEKAFIVGIKIVTPFVYKCCINDQDSVTDFRKYYTVF